MTNTYRISLSIGFAAGYAVLAALLFLYHSDPMGTAMDLAPFFAVGAIGLGIVAFAPNTSEPVSNEGLKSRLSLFGCGQRLSVLQMAGISATGFFFGVLISKLLRLIA